MTTTSVLDKRCAAIESTGPLAGFGRRIWSLDYFGLCTGHTFGVLTYSTLIANGRRAEIQTTNPPLDCIWPPAGVERVRMKLQFLGEGYWSRESEEKKRDKS
jgi:hypothetical protein